MTALNVRPIIFAGLAISMATGCGSSASSDAPVGTARAGTPTEVEGAAATAAALGADSGSEADADACAAFAATACTALGEASESCLLAREIGQILSPKACAQASVDWPVTLTRISTQRGPCETLVTKLCEDLGPKTSACTSVRDRAASLPTARCPQMLEEYDAVLAEVQSFERRNSPLSETDMAALTGGNPPSHGPDSPVLTLVIFSDFECPYCAMTGEVVANVRAAYKDKVRLVFRNFPLSFHANAERAAAAGLEAHAQGKFWALHDAMLQNQDKLTREGLMGLAEGVGMDGTALAAALDSGKYTAQIAADKKLAEGLAIDGTPTLFVGPHRIENPTDWMSVSRAIDLTLKGVDPADADPADAEPADPPAPAAP